MQVVGTDADVPQEKPHRKSLLILPEKYADAYVRAEVCEVAVPAPAAGISEVCLINPPALILFGGQR